MNIWGAVAIGWQLIEGLAKAVPHLLDLLARRRAESRKRKLEEAIEQAQKPDKSIEETANAAKEIERRLNSHSHRS